MSRLAFSIATAAIAVTLLSAPLRAADEYQPQVGQPGKDVIWVPTPDALVERMLDMAKATPKDFVVDLGSGDGRTVIAAAKRGINALGIEYNPEMVTLSIRNAEKAGVSERAKFVHGDVFASDFSKATVVTMYLLSSLNLKLRPTLLDMKPGTRLVSHAFTMGDWQADETADVEGYRAYLWIVPAKVQGKWQVSIPAGSFDLALEQSFQQVSGKAAGSGVSSGGIYESSLQGSAISFALADASGKVMRFKGTVNGDTMQGTAQSVGSAEMRWSARRRG
jgi:SAM-dependent methyltransferase